MAQRALAAASRAGLAVAFLLAGCSSTRTYGTHRLRHEWSLFGICGPYSRTWLEDGSGTEVLYVTESCASPDRRWLALFDTSSTPSTLHLVDAERDALRALPAKACLWERRARWSPDGAKLAILAGEDPTRLCVVSVGEEPLVEWLGDDPRNPTELKVRWRDGTARIQGR